MKPDEVVQRARSAIDKGCIYKLGQGGFSPRSLVPWGSTGMCDCSGFTSWCVGVSRQTDNPWYKKFNGGWFETSAMVADCKTPFGFFDGIAWEEAEPGMLLVWGDRKIAGKSSQGHVGIISECHTGGPNQVIHCSSGNYRKTGDAIRETDVDIFKANGAIVARCAFVRNYKWNG